MPVALGPWALDSGGFTQLNLHGKWTISEQEYVDAVHRYANEIGNLEWASPQDHMCEPFITAKTGKSVREHQELTVQNYLDLTAMAPELPFVPVLQGWELDDYLVCLDLYAQAGVDLRSAQTVGVGSVCRRQNTDDIGHIMKMLQGEGLKLHGYGVKGAGLQKYSEYLYSADSMAWSFGARWNKVRLPQCEHPGMCNNCLAYALVWREEVLSKFKEK